ncbi:MAG: alpha/beta fold hydrolase [Actinomycetia bacterium]|nr:alpha/beta fold hydrolase [Actinomycetes bacterium]
MRWLVAALGLGLGVAALIWFGQRSLIFFPDRADPGSVAERVQGGRDVTVRTSDGLDLRAWLLPPTGADRALAVLYLPGNGGNRLGRQGAGEALAAEGFTVLLLDYRGYGGNPGSPGEEGLQRDAEAAVEYLGANGFPPGRTIYLGESIGTGVAAHLALTQAPAGVLLRSPYTSLPDVARSAYGVPLGWAMRDQFDTLSRMPQISSPVTVLYGESDTIIPPAQSQAVADAAANLHEVHAVPGAGHNDPLWFGALLAERAADLADAGRPAAGD